MWTGYFFSIILISTERAVSLPTQNIMLNTAITFLFSWCTRHSISWNELCELISHFCILKCNTCSQPLIIQISIKLNCLWLFSNHINNFFSHKRTWLTQILTKCSVKNYWYTFIKPLHKNSYKSYTGRFRRKGQYFRGWKYWSQWEKKVQMNLSNSKWLPRQICQIYKYNSTVNGNKETEFTCSKFSFNFNLMFKWQVC